MIESVELRTGTGEKVVVSVSQGIQRPAETGSASYVPQILDKETIFTSLASLDQIIVEDGDQIIWGSTGDYYSKESIDLERVKKSIISLREEKVPRGVLESYVAGKVESFNNMPASPEQKQDWARNFVDGMKKIAETHLFPGQRSLETMGK